MFAADLKISKRLCEYEELSRDIRQETRTPCLTVKRKEYLSDILAQVTNFGRMLDNDDKFD